MRRLGPVLVGLYAWTVTVAFGAVLLDVVGANQDPGTSTVVSTEVSDFLLGVVSLTVLTAIGAIGASWEWKPDRYLLVASLVVVLAGLLIPALLSDAVRGAEDALGVRIGPWLRIGDTALASILAFAGLRASWRNA